jgi:hypothetical protein
MTYEQLRPDGLLGTGTHEAFIEAGVEKSTLWIAAYPASIVDGEIVSQPGVMPRTGRTFDEEVAECANTEIMGHEGKHRLMSAWDWSLLAHLAIVRTATIRFCYRMLESQLSALARAARPSLFRQTLPWLSPSAQLS